LFATLAKPQILSLQTATWHGFVDFGQATPQAVQLLTSSTRHVPAQQTPGPLLVEQAVLFARLAKPQILSLQTATWHGLVEAGQMFPHEAQLLTSSTRQVVAPLTTQQLPGP
jgi:hypothetical protein